MNWNVPMPPLVVRGPYAPALTKERGKSCQHKQKRNIARRTLTTKLEKK